MLMVILLLLVIFLYIFADYFGDLDVVESAVCRLQLTNLVDLAVFL